MKKSLTFVVAALVMISAFTGCEKGDTTGTYSMTANIGGTPVAFDNSLVNVVSKPITGTVSYVIQGLNNQKSYPYIYIYIPTNTTGTYSIGGYGSPVYAIYAVDTLTTKYSNSGSLVFAAGFPLATGAYSFTCTDGTVISSGSFSAKGLN